VTDRATEYATSVVAGDTPTGELVRLACERHLRDLDNQEKLGLWWDVPAVEAFFEFSELHHHYKGRWARVPCTCAADPKSCERRIVLQPWQAFVGGSLVGWKRENESGGLVRRFDTGFVLVSRKTGKTHFGVIVGNYLTFCEEEPSAEGYIGAAAGHQARYVHDIFKSVVRASPNLKTRINGWHQKFANLSDESGSYIEPVSSESKNLDSLSPHFILLDEVHAHKNSSVRDVLQTGTGGRDQPLLLEISTAGEVREESICLSERDYGEQIVRGDLEDESFFAFIAEMDKGDDWKDIRNYYKCTPSLGVTIREEDLKRDLDRAIANPLIRDSFKTKRGNMFLDVFSGMFDPDSWRECDGEIDFKAIRGRQCFGGIDLSQKVDMSALALVFPPIPDEERWIALVHYWIPALTLEKKALKDKPLVRWSRDGLVEIAGESRVDYEFIRNRIASLSERYSISEIGFDPWKATQLADELEKDGQMMVEVRQGHRTLSEATDELVSIVTDRKLCYGNNPVVRWNAKHCVAREDENGNRIPSKKRSRGNIDGISAIIIAISRALAVDSAYSQYAGDDGADVVVTG